MELDEKSKTTTKTDIVDVKYSNVPNICFSLTDKTDDREVNYAKQRQLRGFDDSETWSLTDTICHFILPRLERFKEINASTPYQLTKQEWNGILDKIIISLQLVCKDRGSRIWNNEEKKQIDEGLYLFREWFMALWW